MSVAELKKYTSKEMQMYINNNVVYSTKENPDKMNKMDTKGWSKQKLVFFIKSHNLDNDFLTWMQGLEEGWLLGDCQDYID